MLIHLPYHFKISMVCVLLFALIFLNFRADFLCVSLQICVGEKVLKFYWFDAYEDRFKQPGILKLSSPWKCKGNSNLSIYK